MHPPIFTISMRVINLMETTSSQSLLQMVHGGLSMWVQLCTTCSCPGVRQICSK